MKIQKWHLFVFVTVLFGFSFYVINLKFDKFYRVNGINNDNRVLIEKYLTKNEQSYLIDNQIKIDLFIDYIEYEEFDLTNYQYYNLLEKTQRYKKKTDILNIGNELSSRLSYIFNDKAPLYAKKMIEYSLESAYLNSTDFNIEYMDLYAYLSQLYDKNDYSYISDTHTYISMIHSMGVTNENQLNSIFSVFSKSYNKNTLKQFLNAELSEDVSIVLNSDAMHTIVDQYHYIGKYEPSELLLIQDVPRIRYAMYLKNEAYNALLKMYEDINDLYKGFLLRGSYKSYETLPSSQIGFDEFQLGLSIDVSQQGVSYKQFENTEMSQWLEEHAYEYGYILRYPPNKASITGYEYDSHIYRYVGKDLARILHDSSLSLDEYYKTKE